MIPYVELHGFSVGPLTIQPFGMLIALGVIVGGRIAVRHAIRSGLDPTPLAGFLVWGLLGGIVGGHLVHVLLYHPEELSLLKVVRFWDGLSSMGGILGGVAALWIYLRVKKVPFSRYADSLALGIAPAWCIGRIGCFLVHDHPGVRSDFILAVQYPGGARHDLGLYDMLLLLAVSLIVHGLQRRKVLTGRLLAVVAVLYGTGRFWLDFLRASDTHYADARYFGLTPAQYICVLLVIWGAWAIGASFRAGHRSPIVPD